METIISGLKINYMVMGEGRPFLILHGWGSEAFKWQNVGEQLSHNGYKVIIPDLPGFGQSQEPPKPWGLNEYCDFIEQFMAEIAAKTGFAEFYLLGHSFGGALAVKYALKHPEKIEKLFLVSAALIRKKTTKKRLYEKISKLLKIFSFLPFYNSAKKAFYKFIVKRSDYLNFSGVMKESYLKIIKEDLTDVLNKIEVPAILIWGEKDDITPLNYARLINKEIKDSKLAIIKGVGHDLERIAKPEILAQKILENI